MYFNLILTFFLLVPMSFAQMNHLGVAQKLEEFRAGGVFTDAKVIIFKLDEELGKTSIVLDEGIGSEEAIFDLASLSKFYTATLVLNLVSSGKINLEDHLGKFFKNIPEDKRGITVESLLTHSSGLISSYLVSDLKGRNLDKIAARLLRYDLRQKNSDGFLYSDTNFTLLSLIAQKVVGKSLKKQLSTFSPQLKETFIYKVPRNRDYVLSHRDSKAQRRTHDPRARVFSKGAGHAGVFSSARDLMSFTRSIFSIKGKHRGISKLFIEGGNDVRSLGLDRNSSYSLFLRGDCMDASRTLTHTGFTGTSLTIDLERRLGVILLTNRSLSKLGKKSFKKIKELRSFIAQKACEL